MSFTKQTRRTVTVTAGDWPELPAGLFPREPAAQEALERWWFTVKERLDAKVSALETIAKSVGSS
jgi:hypothetical protein